MPPLIRSRVCPELVRIALERKMNGHKSVVLHSKEIAALLLPTDTSWCRKRVPENLLIHSCRLLRCAEMYPPPGFSAEEQHASRGMAVRFSKVEVG